MDQELSKKLNECGVKKSEIEKILNMPKNSLSGMIHDTRPTPGKWAKKLQEFVESENFLTFNTEQGVEYWKEPQIGVVMRYVPPSLQKYSTDCSEDIKSIPIPTVAKEGLLTMNPTPNKWVIKPEPWVKLIEDYCQEKGIIPEHLIHFHQMSSQQALTTKIKVSKNQVQVKDLNEQAKAKGSYDRRFNKLGF